MLRDKDDIFPLTLNLSIKDDLKRYLHLTETADLTWIKRTTFGLNSKHKSNSFVITEKDQFRKKLIANLKDKEGVDARLFHPECRYSVIQQYFKSPFLLDGFKVDLRTIVSIISVRPPIIAFNSGYIRRASAKFEPQEEGLDRYAYLTNLSTQKMNPHYDKIKSQLIIPFTRFKQHLGKLKSESLMQRVKQIISDIMSQLMPNLDSTAGRFSLVGFDFIFDQTLENVKLLKIKQNPGYLYSNSNTLNHFRQIIPPVNESINF